MSKNRGPAHKDAELAEINGWTVDEVQPYLLRASLGELSVYVEYSVASNGVLRGSISSPGHRTFLTGARGRDRDVLRALLTAD